MYILIRIRLLIKNSFCCTACRINKVKKRTTLPRQSAKYERLFFLLKLLTVIQFWEFGTRYHDITSLSQCFFFFSLPGRLNFRCSWVWSLFSMVSFLRKSSLSTWLLYNVLILWLGDIRFWSQDVIVIYIEGCQQEPAPTSFARIIMLSTG